MLIARKTRPCRRGQGSPILCYTAPMTDPTDETPIERALRLRKAQLAARQRPSGEKTGRRDSAAARPGSNKPWMKKG